MCSFDFGKKIIFENFYFRPKRQRKLPARMQNQDFEYGFGPAMALELEAEKAEDEKPAAGPKKRGPNRKTAAAAKQAPKTEETVKFSPHF